MIYEIELCIKLKTEDVSAVTAKITLQEEMGYQGILENLEREKYWKIEVEAKNEEEATKLGKEFAEKRKIFVNPNKHIYKLKVGKLRNHQGMGKQIEKELYKMKVLVSYREDEKAILTKETLQTTLGYGRIIKNVQRGILWTLYLKAKDEQGAQELTKEITVTQNIDKGLLMNPHSQKYKLYS